MIDRKVLLTDCQRLLKKLEKDIRQNIQDKAELRATLEAEHQKLREGRRTTATFDSWATGHVTRAAVSWILGCIFVRFLEDNHLIDEPFITGPRKGADRVDRFERASQRRERYFSKHPAHSDVEYLQHDFEQVRGIPACRDLFAHDRNPLWKISPSADGAVALLAFWREIDPDKGELKRPSRAFRGVASRTARRIIFVQHYRGGDAMDMSAIQQILGSALRNAPAKSDSEWSVWEHKTFNIHRGVLVWTPRCALAAYSEVSAAVRGKIAATFKPSWWRGFAFGVLVELPELPRDVRDCEIDVDVRDNSKGTWQWIVLVCPSSKVGVGIHTWTAGYLSPVYQALADHYRSLGCNVGSFKKEKDRLMAFLLAASGMRFDEFRPT